MRPIQAGLTRLDHSEDQLWFCPAGSVTLEDLLTVLPFAGTFDRVQLKGSTLRAAFEHGAHRYGSKAGEFLQVSGRSAARPVRMGPTGPGGFNWVQMGPTGQVTQVEVSLTGSRLLRVLQACVWFWTCPSPRVAGSAASASCAPSVGFRATTRSGTQRCTLWCCRPTW